MKMKTTVVSLLFILPFLGAAPLPPVKEVEEGDDVWLPCQQHPEVNLTGSLVEWTKDGRQTIVHVNRHGYDYLEDQKKEFKGRTSLSHPGLNRGDATLKLSPVRRSDNGTYRCYVKKRDANHYITLRVVEKKVQTDRPEDDLMTTPAPVPNEPDQPVGKLSTAIHGSVIPIVTVTVILVIGALIYRCNENFRMMLRRCMGREGEGEGEGQTEPNKVELENLMNRAEEKRVENGLKKEQEVV